MRSFVFRTFNQEWFVLGLVLLSEYPISLIAFSIGYPKSQIFDSCLPVVATQMTIDCWGGRVRLIGMLHGSPRALDARAPPSLHHITSQRSGFTVTTRLPLLWLLALCFMVAAVPASERRLAWIMTGVFFFFCVLGMLVKLLSWNHSQPGFISTNKYDRNQQTRH